MKLGLSSYQKNIFDEILNTYKDKREFTGKIIFTTDKPYIPPKFAYSQTYNNLPVEELLKVINNYSTGARQHDGFVFISSNGIAITGGVLDATELITKFPKRINEPTAAGAFMKLVTKYNTDYVKCAMICTRRVSIFYKGKEKKLYKFGSSINEANHNYGIGFFTGYELPYSDNIKLIKMIGFRRTLKLETIDLVAKELLTIAFDYYHHDGFWQYNQVKKTISGPYLVVTKTHDEHLAGSGGMKRLTAKLLAHYTHSATLILREGSKELAAFGEVDKNFLENLQLAINQRVQELEAEQTLMQEIVDNPIDSADSSEVDNSSELVDQS